MYEQFSNPGDGPITHSMGGGNPGAGVPFSLGPDCDYPTVGDSQGIPWEEYLRALECVVRYLGHSQIPADYRVTVDSSSPPQHHLQTSSGPPGAADTVGAPVNQRELGTRQQEQEQVVLALGEWFHLQQYLFSVGKLAPERAQQLYAVMNNIPAM